MIPRLPERMSAMGASPYSALASRAAAADGEKYPFHVGDSWMEPPVGCRMGDLRTSDWPGLHAYTDVRGWPRLVERLASYTSERWGVPVAPDEILVTAGGTGGLGALAGASLEPGDEVLILAPYWPLIAGIVRSFHAVPVAVPFWVPTADSLPVIDAESAVAAVDALCTPRTRVLYVNSPHNPTGGALDREWIDALVAWARSRGLWIWSDEVYERLGWGAPHVPIRTVAPECTISVHSFSKSFAMAGNRCGWLVGPPDVLAAAAKVGINTYYHAPTPAMVAGFRALELGDAFVTAAREQYAETARVCAEILGVPAPQGATFLFLDVADAAERAGGLPALLEQAADQGILVAPGPSFGPYPRHLRLCFTVAPPDVTRRGIEKLAAILGR